MKNNFNKKKCFLVLLILTLVGVVGYGVYSYYYASGSVTHTGTIEIDGFDVTLYNGAQGDFIGNDSEVDIGCEYDSGETFICESSNWLYNHGTKDVNVEISNLDITLSGYDNASITSITFEGDDWTKSNGVYSATVYSGYMDGQASFYIIVKVDVPGYVVPSDNGVEVTEAISGGELEVIASYDITATEVHD